MVEIKMLPIAKILVPERLRKVEEGHALAISASIVEHGLINPITVRATPRAEKPWTLVAGAHRLRAVELTDDHEIEAIVVAADAAEGRMQEIVENLFRNELSALDRAIFVVTYREVWEEKHGAIARGRPGNSVNLTELLAEEGHNGFSAHVADRLGLSVSAIERAQKIGKSLVPELRHTLRGTPEADNQSTLLRLAKLPPDEQRAIAQTGGTKGSISPAGPAPTPVNPQHKFYDTLVATWDRADPATRRRFLEFAASPQGRKSAGGDQVATEVGGGAS